MTIQLPLGNEPVLVVGAGLMGSGIAQVARQAGHRVMLFDARPHAAEAARARLSGSLYALVAKGRMDGDTAALVLARITPTAALDDARDAGLVIQAIVEDLAAKRSLFAQHEALSRPRTVLASNTSSISITALAAGLHHSGRLVGMHFFNPVPLMKLVEVVSGLHTAPDIAAGAGRLPARSGLPHGAVRADGPDRPRHQLRRHAVGVRGLLLRPPLHPVAAAARHGARRPAGPQERTRLLRPPARPAGLAGGSARRAGAAVARCGRVHRAWRRPHRRPHGSCSHRLLQKLGVNYPAGPFEWLQAWGAPGVLAVLDALDAHYRGERYRASPWLRR